MKNDHHGTRVERGAGHDCVALGAFHRFVATGLRWTARAGVAALAAGTLAVWAQTEVEIQPPNLSGPIAGSLSGQPGVSSGGAASYSVSLTLPPGTAGMAPALSLDYSSQSGMSSLGMGWRLDGLSQITRCPKTIVQDGVRRGVTLSAEDQFCLDGQRLLMVAGSGTHGAAAEYRVQIDGQSRIQSFGSDPAKGPDSFEVRGKKGLIFTYGKTVDATIEAQGTGRPVLTWALSRVMDRRGNYYDVRYAKSNTATLGEVYPDRILYTGHLDQGGGGGNVAPYNAVRFVYEDRPDLQLGFVAGSRVTASKRMTKVQTFVGTDANGDGGTVAREYRIGYVTNATNGRSLVDRITDCGPYDQCLPATTFTWTVPDPANNTGAAAGSGNWGGPQVAITALQLDGDRSTQVKAQVVMGDFNGDGRVDLMRGDGSNWQVCLSTGTSFDCSNWMASSVLTRDVVSGDFNGDGKTDIAVYPKVDGPGNWTVCLSSGTGFNCSLWAGYGASNLYANGQTSGALVGDFNGDGRDDIAIAGPNGDNERMCWSTGSGFQGGTCQTYPGSFLFMYYAKLLSEESIQAFQTGQMAVDIDGDGRADIIQYVGNRRNNPTIYPKGGWMGIRATDAGFVAFSASSTGQVLLDGVTSPGNSRTADLTGDPYGSMSDVVNGYITDSTNPARMELCRSNGLTLMNCQVLPGAADATGPVMYVRDLDGDGRPDVIAGGQVCQLNLVAYGANNADQYSLNCAPRAAGTGNVDTGTALVSYAGDFNGDGRGDGATYIMTSNSTGYWSVHLSGHVGFADLLDTVTSGVGQPTRFIYKRQSDPSIYTSGAAVTYPKRNLVGGGGALVSSMLTGNGMVGWLTTDYQYEAARADQSGRGSLGFEKRRVIDRTKNITAQTTVSQDFPTIGMPLETRSTQANGTVLSLSTVSYASLATTAGALCPYPQASTLQTRDLDGTLIATTTSAINSGGIDSYCNVTDASETVSGADGTSFSTRTVTRYLNNTANWLIGLPTSSSVTKTAVQPYADANSLALTSCAASTPSGSAATFSCTLANRGPAPATSIAYASGAGTTVSGPSSCAPQTTNCGAVTVTTSAAGGDYVGQVTATPSTLGAATSANYALKVLQLPALTLSQCSGTAPGTGAGVFSCRLGNSGTGAGTGIAYQAGSGVTVAGPTSCAAAIADCGGTVTTAASAGTYAGTVSATAGNGGSGASTGYSLTVNTPPALALTNCASSATSTAAGTMSCTLSNSGQTAAGTVAYAAGAGVTVGGPGSCAAGSGNCGTVTLTTSGSPGTYAGTLTATPSPGGGAASAGYSLKVNTPTSLVLSNCSSSAASTSAATMTCTLGNGGQTAASGITYGAGSGASASGPTTCAASTGNCGTVTVTTSGSPGVYSGTLSVSPASGGNGTSTTYSLTVNTGPQLALTNCSSSSASTSAATFSCTLVNNGQTAASSVAYAAGGGVSIAGPASCAASSGNCGTVTVTTSGSPSVYTGTLTATPTPGGTAGSAAYSLTVYTPPALSLSNCSSSTPTTSAATMSCTLGNSGQTAASGIGYGAGSGVSVGGPSSCAAGSGNCGTVTVTTAASAGTYGGTLSALPGNGGSGASVGYALTVNTPPALALTSCSSTAPSGSAGSMSCALVNNGQTTATGVSYGAGAGVSVSGPSSCAAGSNCGTVTVTSSASPGTYAGTLSASPTNGGSGASAAYSLTVYTPPSLRFAGCSSTSNSTAAGTLTCTLANDGQSGTSLGYGSGAGTTVNGPGSCAGSTANCGAVVLTTSTTPGDYLGQLAVNALSGGTGVGTGYSLRVYSNGTTLTASPLTLDWSTVTGGGSTKTMTIQNTGLAPATLSWTTAYTAGSIGMGGYAVTPAQSTCTSGQTLDIGQSCTVAWTLTTQCSAKGQRTLQMKINGGTSQVTATLTANVQRTTICN